MARKSSKQESKLILIALAVGIPFLVLQKLIDAGALPYLAAIACVVALIYAASRVKRKNAEASPATPSAWTSSVARAPRPNSEVKFQFVCAVVGESFKNPDGTSRQAHIRKSVRSGMPASLVLEPDNPHDPTAVAVFVADRQIGYLKRDVAQRLSDNLKYDEFSAEAVVHGVHGGEGSKEHLGVTLELTVFCNESGYGRDSPATTPQQIRYELSYTHKDDLEVMVECCMQEEIEFMATPDGVRRLPHAIFFQRAAILNRKAKNYAAEIAICERWLAIVSRYQSQQFAVDGGEYPVGTDKTHINIVERVEKARSLLARQGASQ